MPRRGAHLRAGTNVRPDDRLPVTTQAPPSRTLLFLLVAITSVAPLSLNIPMPALPGIARALQAPIEIAQLTLVALSDRARGRADGERRAVGSLRPPAGAHRRTADHRRRQHRGRGGDQYRHADRGALAAGDRRLRRHRAQPRHHPRSLRPRAGRLDDRLGHDGDHDRADGRAVARRRHRCDARLALYLPLHRGVHRRRADLGVGLRCRRRGAHRCRAPTRCAIATNSRSCSRAESSSATSSAAPPARRCSS